MALFTSGNNVFGWTIDEKTLFDALDAFFSAGLTADLYSIWASGNKGRESESNIGK